MRLVKVMRDATKEITIDDFWAFVNLPENADRWFELDNGEIIEMAPPSALHVRIVGLIFAALHYYAKAHDLGFAFPDGCGYSLTNRKIVIPDVSFVAKNRLILPLPQLLPLSPDLAIEVVSPSEKELMVFEKARTYLLNDTKIVWVVFPENHSVYVCTLQADKKLVVDILDKSMTLSGGDVLPNFSLPVADIFPDDE